MNVSLYRTTVPIAGVCSLEVCLLLNHSWKVVDANFGNCLLGCIPSSVEATSFPRMVLLIQFEKLGSLVPSLFTLFILAKTFVRIGSLLVW